MFNLYNFLLNNTNKVTLLKSELIKHSGSSKKSDYDLKVIPLQELEEYQIVHKIDNYPFTKIFNKYLLDNGIDSVVALCLKNKKKIFAFAIPNINKDEILTNIVDTIHTTSYCDFSKLDFCGRKSLADNWAIFHTMPRPEGDSSCQA